jgi:hypothetical protein
MSQKSLTIQSKYIESPECYPEVGADKVVYSPDSDRMKARYEHYIFPKAEFEAALAGGNTVITFTVVGTSGSASTCTQGAQPEGGIQNKFFACINVSGGAGSSSSDDDDS